MGRPAIIDKEAVLRAARQVFIQNGAFGSTKDIAQLAGVSEALLFKRYPTKAALFVAAMAPPNVDPAAILRAAESVKDPHAAFIALGESVLAYFREAVPIMSQLVRNPLIGFDALQKHFGKNPAVLLTGAARSFFQAQCKQGLMSGDPHSAAALLVTCLHSIAQFELMGLHGGVVSKRDVRSLLDTLWTGVAPRPRSRSRKRRGPGA
jgi:AcrR family transcriptional regulator